MLILFSHGQLISYVKFSNLENRVHFILLLLLYFKMFSPVTCFLTPAKSPMKNVLSSSLKVKARISSFFSQRNSHYTKSSAARTFGSFLSPTWCSQHTALNEEVQMKRCVSAQSSVNKRTFLEQSNVSRCLFTSSRPSRDFSHNNYYSTPKKSLLYPNHNSVPSFDTPDRRAVSPDGFHRKMKGFILGRGSYGLVVKGRYKDEHVAVKLLSRVKDQLVHNSFEREKNALKLIHPNIVQVYKVVKQDDINIGFVIMELYDYMNLESLLEKEILRLKIKLRFLKEIGSALEYCHKNDIVHLDVKPKNIIVNSLKKSCKLCDFGSSKNLSVTSKNSSPSKGTLKYSAPEILKGEAATKKADVYSFGITMWQLIYQQIPFDSEDLHVVVYKVVTKNYRPGETNSSFNSVDPVYKACWDAEQSKRPSISQVIGMLNRIKLINTV